MTLLAICLCCPHVQPPPYRGPCVCTVDGRDVTEHVRRGECPKGRFAGVRPDEPPVPFPCIHRGEPAGEGRCATCAGNVRVPLFACKVHGSCAIGKTPEGVRSCAGCADRRPPGE